MLVLVIDAPQTRFERFDHAIKESCVRLHGGDWNFAVRI